MDGTFETCPRLFYQIFTIHIIKYSQTFPMVYALLPNKQQSTYNHMFMMVKEAALDHGLDLTPSSVLSDFEQALINALRLNFPTAEHGLLKPLLPSNLVKGPGFGEYRSENGILKSFVQKTAATCFVPPNFVRVAWQGVQQEARELDNIDDCHIYFDKTWTNGQFRLQQWNYYNYNGLRTNNHVEIVDVSRRSKLQQK